MSTSKRIDTICIVVCLLTALLTGLFIKGEALGVAVISSGDVEDGPFTQNDWNGNWDRTGAVQITLSGASGSVKGSGAYFHDGDLHIVYPGKYILSGELTGGSVIVDATSADKIWLLLDGVSLHCEDGAALQVEQADKVFLTLGAGTENSISSGSEYSQEAVSAGIDGAIYSRDDLTINGSGSLSVNAGYKHAVVCHDDLVVTGGRLDITAAQDGVHANDSFRFAQADMTINAGDDGITVSNDEGTGYVYIASGDLSIPSCYEGIEAVDITVAGGTLDIRPTDDGLNANGQGSGVIRITGGDVTVINETGRDADGLDSNGDIDISGGNIFISVNASGGNCALDCGSESGGVCKISGGTVIAAGGSAMAEGFDSSSEQCFIMHNTATASAGTAVTLKGPAGNSLLSGTVPCSFSSLVLSTPELQLGQSVTLAIGDTETELTVDNSSSSGGFGMGGVGMRGGMRGDRTTGQAIDALGQSTPEMPEGENPFAGRGAAGEDFRRGGFIPGDMEGRTPPDGLSLPQGAPDRQNEEPPSDLEGQADPDAQPGQNRFHGMGGDWPGGDRAAQRGQDQAQSDTETSAPSREALILVGVSALVLLAGLLVAVKVKH